jgi:Cu(I)/Ag(I) efflux system membrane fusion protein
MPAVHGAFPAGTLADAEIRLPARQALTLAQDSIIRTGHGDFVIVADGDDHFRQVEVALGAQAGDSIEVRSGLESGQRVVTNGQFLLSAEATLAATRQRLSAHAAP